MENSNYQNSLYINKLLPFMTEKYLFDIFSPSKYYKQINVTNDAFSIPGKY